MNGNNYYLEKGATLSNGKYIIGDKLGSGGFGITYKGIYSKEVDIEERFHNMKTTVSIPVAIKELFIEGKCVRNTNATDLSVQSLSSKNFQDFKDRFLKEAETLSQFRDVPQIVHVIDYFEENDTAYMIMEFVEGETLNQLVRSKGPLEEDETVDYICQIASGLKHVHKENVIHRDIKPDNIIVSPDGLAVLIDFGSARGFVADKSVTQSVMLTHGYAPIEQYSLKRERGPFTDIYALGGTLYFCLTGRKPDSIYDRTPNQVIELSNNSQSLSLIVNKAMAYNGHDRYQSCKALIEKIKNIQNSENSINQKIDLDSEQTIFRDGLEKSKKTNHQIENNTIVVNREEITKTPNRQNKKIRNIIITIVSGIILFFLGFFIAIANSKDDDGKVDKQVSLKSYSTLMKTSKSTYFKDETFEGEIVVGNTDGSRTPNRAELTLDGKQLVQEKDFILENEKVKLQLKTGDIGEHTIKGHIFLEESSTEIPVEVNSTFVTVAKSNTAMISTDNMYILYRGINNPITISFPGIPDNKVVASASGLSRVGGNKYILNTTSIKGKEVNINVTGTLPDGGKVSDNFNFRIKDLPKPTGTIRGEDGVVKMQRKTLEESIIGAKFEDFKLPLRVTGFKIKIHGQPTINVKGSKLDSRAKLVLNKAKRGSGVLIFDIEAKASDVSVMLKKVSLVFVELTN